jgi:hypothetical protein
MTSPSSQTVSADAALQIQAGRDLRTHSDGIVSDMNRLRNLTQNLPAGLQGGTLTATMAAHETLYADVQRQAQRLGQHGDHFVSSANTQSAADQDTQQQVMRTVAPSTSSVSSINM